MSETEDRVKEPVVAAMARAGYEEIRKIENTRNDLLLEPWEETPQDLKDDWIAAARAMRDAQLDHVKGPRL